MIRSVAIKGWKAYNSLTLPFGSGTTFLVARNGIGKTSIMQAVAFTIFGRNALPFDPKQGVRRSAGDEASLAVELQLPSGAIVNITRVVPAERRRSQAPSFSAFVGRDELSEKELSELLRAEFGADPATLQRLVVVPEGAVILEAEDPFNPVDHINKIFNADQLKSTAEQFLTIARRSSEAGDGMRRIERRASKGEIDALETELATLTEREHELEEAREVLRSRLETVRRQRDIAERWKAHGTAVEAEASRVENAVASARRQFPEATEADDLRLRLETTIGDLARNREALLSERADIVARLRVAHEGLGRLQEAGAICPVCRRPLSDQDHAQAAEYFDAEIAALESRLRDIETSSEGEKETAQRLSAVLADVEPREISEPPEPNPDKPYEALVSEFETLSRDLDSVSEQVGSVRSRAQQAQATRSREEESRQVSERAFVAYRTAYLSELAAGTLAELADRIFQERVRPLSDLLTSRWKELWTGEGSLVMLPNGSLALEQQGVPLSFRHFSGGERAFAVVLQRLLTLRATTRARFLWLDEPLEHVDPRNRRVLASLFTGASRADDMAQIVVTTYEERVTRRLAARRRLEADGARVIYVDSP
jgi:DNA repair exonuclease SbcCD ATPase subunit